MQSDFSPLRICVQWKPDCSRRTSRHSAGLISSVFLEPDVLERGPVVRLEDHHVVEEAAGEVAELVRPGDRGQHLAGHRQQRRVAHEAQHLLLLVLDTHKLCSLVLAVSRLWHNKIYNQKDGTISSMRIMR